MDVIVRSNNNQVNDMPAPVSWPINDLGKVIKTKSSRSRYSYHQQDKQILGGCLHNQEGQAAVQT